MKSVVLLSSGLDSTVNLYEAHQQGPVLLALTFDYGQKAAIKEVSQAQRICAALRVPHKVVALPFFKEFAKSSLIVEGLRIPQGDEVRIDDSGISQRSAKSVWVPNRNGIFLNIAAGYAEALGAEVVIPGFNKEEAATFADNSSEYLASLNEAFSFSTAGPIKVHCYTSELDKTQIVRRGKALAVDFSSLWPCYHSYEKWCGQCESCQRAQRAFAAVEVNTQGWFL